MFTAAIIVIATFAALAAAISGADIRYFERMKESNLLHYQRLVWACRGNGVLVAAAASIGAIGCITNLVSEWNWKAVPAMLFFVFWLCIAMRYARWGWAIPLVYSQPPKK